MVSSGQQVSGWDPVQGGSLRGEVCCRLLLFHCCVQYVSEAVAALADVPLKSSDIPAAVEMAAALHARYDSRDSCLWLLDACLLRAESL